MKDISWIYHVEWCRMVPNGIGWCSKGRAGETEGVSLHRNQ